MPGKRGRGKGDKTKNKSYGAQAQSRSDELYRGNNDKWFDRGVRSDVVKTNMQRNTCGGSARLANETDCTKIEMFGDPRFARQLRAAVRREEKRTEQAAQESAPKKQAAQKPAPKKQAAQESAVEKPAQQGTPISPELLVTRKPEKQAAQESAVEKPAVDSYSEDVRLYAEAVEKVFEVLITYLGVDLMEDVKSGCEMSELFAMIREGGLINNIDFTELHDELMSKVREPLEVITKIDSTYYFDKMRFNDFTEKYFDIETKVVREPSAKDQCWINLSHYHAAAKKVFLALRDHIKCSDIMDELKCCCAMSEVFELIRNGGCYTDEEDYEVDFTEFHDELMTKVREPLEVIANINSKHTELNWKSFDMVIFKDISKYPELDYDFTELFDFITSSNVQKPVVDSYSEDVRLYAEAAEKVFEVLKSYMTKKMWKIYYDFPMESTFRFIENGQIKYKFCEEAGLWNNDEVYDKFMDKIKEPFEVIKSIESRHRDFENENLEQFKFNHCLKNSAVKISPDLIVSSRSETPATQKPAAQKPAAQAPAAQAPAAQKPAAQKPAAQAPAAQAPAAQAPAAEKPIIVEIVCSKENIEKAKKMVEEMFPDDFLDAAIAAGKAALLE